MRSSIAVGSRAGENRGGSRHYAGTKGAGTRMAARAGTGYGVYTMSASAVWANRGRSTTNCTGTPNAQHGRADERCAGTCRHGTSCAQSASAHGVRTWCGRAPPRDVRRTCTAATVRPCSSAPQRDRAPRNRRAHPTWRRGEHGIGVLRTAAASSGARGLAAPSPSGPKGTKFVHDTSSRFAKIKFQRY